MPLSDARIRKIEIRGKAYMVRDDRGLYLEVQPSGAKYWRIRLWEKGKEIRRSLGVYPGVSLAQARQKRDEIRSKIASGEAPFEKPKTSLTLHEVATEWLDTKVLPIRVPRHSETIISRLNRFVLPFLGDHPINSIQPHELLVVLRRIEAGGIHETAHRVLQICGQLFRYGVATGRCPRDITTDLRGALIPVKKDHHSSITDPRGVGGLMRAIDDYQGSYIVKCAMQLSALTFTRPGEIRHAEWSEFDLAKAEWRIPSEKMKMRRIHVIPLSRQAIAIVESLRLLTGTGRYLFPSVRSRARPISDATVVAALRRMGFGKEEMSHHGFRSMASTILNEKGWPADAIERQLAHVEGNSVRAAYNYAEHMEKRREMMQWWADWLDEQRGEICPFFPREEANSMPTPPGDLPIQP